MYGETGLVTTLVDGDPSTALIVLPTQYAQLGASRASDASIISASIKRKKLKSISEDFLAQFKEFQTNDGKELAKLPPDQRAAKQRELAKKHHVEVVACGKKIEEVLTNEQLAAYKRDFVSSVASHLWDSRLHDLWKLGLSPQQGQQLDRLANDMRRAVEEDGLKGSRQVLAVLTEEQRRALTASLPGYDLAAPGIFVPARNYEGAATALIDDANSLLFQADDSRGARIWICQTLTENAVHKELGLSGPQQESVLAIAKKFQADSQQAFKIYPATNAALDKLSKEEQKAKRAECERKLKDIGSDTIRQVEAVLGPQRWAALKAKLQEAQETTAAGQLMWQYNPMLRTLNLTPEQRAKLRESAEALQARGMIVPRETGEKALAVLTDEQRKKLEDRIEQQGW